MEYWSKHNLKWFQPHNLPDIWTCNCTASASGPSSSSVSSWSQLSRRDPVHQPAKTHYRSRIMETLFEKKGVKFWPNHSQNPWPVWRVRWKSQSCRPPHCSAPSWWSQGSCSEHAPPPRTGPAAPSCPSGPPCQARLDSAAGGQSSQNLIKVITLSTSSIYNY